MLEPSSGRGSRCKGEGWVGGEGSDASSSQLYPEESQARRQVPREQKPGRAVPSLWPAESSTFCLLSIPLLSLAVSAPPISTPPALPPPPRAFAFFTSSSFWDLLPRCWPGWQSLSSLRVVPSEVTRPGTTLCHGTLVFPYALTYF